MNQINCYDRSSETHKFESTDKKIICFLNSAGNGITTFLYNKLQNQQYIFIKENFEHEIIFDFGDEKSNKAHDSIKELLDITIDELEGAKLWCNLFYFFPQQGTFLRNTSIDLINKKLMKANHAKKSFYDFIAEYNTKFNKDNQLIYIICENADFVSKQALVKLRKLLIFDNVKLIFCYDSPCIKPEFSAVFEGEICSIDFSKPSFHNAQIIFRGLNWNVPVCMKDDYEKSSSFKEFERKYVEQSKNTESNINDLYNIINLLQCLPCSISSHLLYLIRMYLTCTASLNDERSFERIINTLVEKQHIIEKNGLYTINFAKHQSNNTLKGFIQYALNYYDKINIDALFYFYDINKDAFTRKQLLHMCLSTSQKSRIALVLGALDNLSQEDFIKAYIHLYNLKLFELLPIYKGNDKAFVLLNTIRAEKQHKKTSPKIYISNINESLRSNIDFACLNAIMYLDYCINHKRDKLSLFLKNSTNFYYVNYAKSKYYYILLSIIAKFIDDSEQAVSIYDEAIRQSKGMESIYITYNKFAYLLKIVLEGNDEKKELLEEIFQQLLNNTVIDVKKDEFLSANIMLYNSLRSNKDCFEHDEVDMNMTWNLFKQINENVFIFANNDCNQLFEYLKCEQIVMSSKRIPTLLLFYYNLYVMGKYYGEKRLMRKAARKLQYYGIRKTDLYEKYLQAQKSSKIINKAMHVKYGYIFTRTFDMNYLFDEIAHINK